MTYNKIIINNCNFLGVHMNMSRSEEKKCPSVSCREKVLPNHLWSDDSYDWSEDSGFTYKSSVKRRDPTIDDDDKKLPPPKIPIKQLPKDDDKEPLIKPDDDIDPDSTVFEPPKKKCSKYFFFT